MVVIRATRESCLAFYNHFSGFLIDYVAASQTPYAPTVSNLNPNLEVINPRFYPAYGIDPVSLITPRINNLSWQYIEGLESLIQKCDIVNLTDTYYFFNRQAVRLARKYNKPVVTIIWTTIPRHPSVWLPPYSWNVKEVVDATDLFILRCKSAYAFTDSLKINREKTAMIYKGVDLEHFYPSPRQIKKTIDILYVGNLHPSKGLLDLLYAFEKLVRDSLPVRLLIAGEGKLQSLINQKAQYLPIRQFGFVNYENLAEVYRQADIFCSPSVDIYLGKLKIWEEYFSYTLMEAQASGIAIVATHSGGIPEEVAPENPLVPQGDIEALHQALKSLVTDRKKRISLGNLNRKRAVSLFDAAKQAKATESAIGRLL